MQLSVFTLESVPCKRMWIYKVLNERIYGLRMNGCQVTRVNLGEATYHDSSWRRPKIEDEQMLIIKVKNIKREKNKGYCKREDERCTECSISPKLKYISQSMIVLRMHMENDGR